jgi:hypothetical protein
MSSFVLSVDVKPDGGGSVDSVPAGINCPPKCTKSYTAGTTVTLTAHPAEGYSFDHWKGACLGTEGPSCTLTMTADRSTSAVFLIQGGTGLPGKPTRGG